jgi:hypothetical protein
VGRPSLGGIEVELHVIPKKKIRVFYDGRCPHEFPYDGK